MGTSFEKIYDGFLKKVTDYSLGELNPEDAEDILFSLLESSVNTIREFRIGSFEYDENAKCFNHVLTHIEEQVAILGMLEFWIGREKSSALYTQQFIATKEQNFFQQRLHMQTLSDIEDKIRRDRNRLLSRYKVLNNTYLENEVVL